MIKDKYRYNWKLCKWEWTGVMMDSFTYSVLMGVDIGPLH